jgi:protein-S-isoprenylcysteine O-methyltransferase Ste14
MGPEVMILIIIFGAIFGVFYLFFSTRNKERLALIEKGVDASIFMTKRQDATPISKVLILNFALLLALTLQEGFGITNEAIYPGTIFLTAGIGLFSGFKMTKELDKK